MMLKAKINGTNIEKEYVLKSTAVIIYGKFARFPLYLKNQQSTVAFSSDSNHCFFSKTLMIVRSQN